MRIPQTLDGAPRQCPQSLVTQLHMHLRGGQRLIARCCDVDMVPLDGLPLYVIDVAAMKSVVSSEPKNVPFGRLNARITEKSRTLIVLSRIMIVKNPAEV